MRYTFNKIMHCAGFLSVMAFAGGAAAADGEITFVGKVTASTCIINASVPNFQVDLPTTSVQTLDSAGKVGGRTAFKISLTSCSAGQDTVGVYFETGSGTNTATNRLINTVSPSSNVEIQILDKDLNVIKLGEPSATQGGQTVEVANGSATLNYFAEYYATGAAAAGDVRASTEYSIVYP